MNQHLTSSLDAKSSIRCRSVTYLLSGEEVGVNEQIFDLSISNSKRLQIIYTLDRSQQNEILRRLLDVYRLSGVKKLEKLFTSICIHDIHLDLHLKIDIFDTVETVITRRMEGDSCKCVAHALSNIQFLVALNAFANNVSWLLFTQWLLKTQISGTLKPPSGVEAKSPSGRFTGLRGLWAGAGLRSQSGTLKPPSGVEAKSREGREVLLRNIVYRAAQEKKPFKQLFNLINHFKDQHFFKALCTLIYLKYDQQLNIKERLLLLQIGACGDRRSSFTGKACDQRKQRSSMLRFEELLRIAEDENVELNLRLEACDIIFLEGSETDRSTVSSIFDSIAPSTEYTNNSENVHIASIQASVERSIDALVNKSKCLRVPPQLIEGLPYTVSDSELNRPNPARPVPGDVQAFGRQCGSEDVLLRRYNEEPEFVKIKGSLHRIFNHTFLKFTKHKLTLRDIIALVCLVIEDCEITLHDELYRRLGQELADMNDTCSRGYVTRLVNVFSGFEIDALGITLSFEDEIYAIFTNKVNKLIADAPDELRDVLLEQLTIPSNENARRQELTRYLRPFLPTVWNEIYTAFEKTLTLTDLDLYSRKVMMRYEGLVI
jgi:hypothetical protein